VKFYKHDPDAFLAGTAMLTLEQTGAYIKLIDLLYSCDDLVLDDDVAIARQLHCHHHTWQRLKCQLIKARKIWIDQGGMIRANRVTETVKEASDFSLRQSHRVRKTWDNFVNSNKNNGGSIRPRNTTNTHTHNSSLSTELGPAKTTDPASFEAPEPKSAEIPVTPQLAASLRAKGWIR
jgi:uncharacterized protein YdaU (DUF1376 family)